MKLSNTKRIENLEVKMESFESKLDLILAQLQAQPKAEKPKKATGSKGELVEFTNSKGETKLVSAKQAKAWGAWKQAGEGRKSLDEVKEEFAEARKGYKPSKELIAAIKADRASITRKIAKEKYGFVGTKDDLKALKDRICK